MCDEYVCRLMVYMNIHAMYVCIFVSISPIHIYVTYEFICDMSRAHIYVTHEFICDMSHMHINSYVTCHIYHVTYDYICDRDHIHT